MPAATPRKTVDEFLSSKRIAMIGVSHNERDFSRNLFREFVEHGYDVVPVNPHLTEAEGRTCFPNVAKIQPPVDGAIVMTAAEHSEQIVSECADAGIRRVWLYRAIGKGAVSECAVDVCRTRDLDVVEGECPFMFLSSSEFPHNVHACIRKLFRSYPA